MSRRKIRALARSVGTTRVDLPIDILSCRFDSIFKRSQRESLRR